ncbi:hypothetical protein BDR07DRAFT_1483591 [Suillus spraguei]|nr:hypothetical protein BDR07DRAFT_1483591 [Suillus spraguei]
MQKVIDHLHNHQADCCILFYSDGKQSQSDSDRPSGKDKVLVCTVIVKYIFEDDNKYRNYYAAAPDKFRDSTNNHINGKKYCECHDRLHATGAGVMPQDEGSVQNLHAQILKEFPWYDDLLSVMGGNPALSLKMVLSHPGVDHAGNYFSISSTAGSSYSDTLRSGSAQFGGQPHPPAAALPSCLWRSAIPLRWSAIPSCWSAIPSRWSAITLLPLMVCHTLPPQVVSHTLVLAVNHTLPLVSHTLLLSLPASGGQPYPATSGSSMGQPFPATSGDQPFPASAHRFEMHSVEVPTPLVATFVSHHSPTSSGFCATKHLADLSWDSHALFGMADLKHCISMGSLKPLTSHCSSGSSQSKVASASLAPMSTSMMSTVNSLSVGKQKQKKQHSDVQNKVDMLNTEIENMQSDKITQEELKNEHYMVKYNFAQQVNEHKFLKHEHADDHAEAVTVHIRGLSS